MPKYRVTGEYINVRTATPNGVMIVGLYKGAPVPADVPPESIRHHLESGLIEALPEPPAPEPAPAKAPEEKPQPARAPAPAARAEAKK